jgi:hypothetical protein
MDATDDTNELARKLIEAFEPLGEEVILEQLAVPEDLDDPNTMIDLWVVGADVHPVGESAEEAIVLRGSASVPTGAVTDLDTGELTELLRCGLLESREFREARLTARVASAGTRTTDIPYGDDIRRN